MSLHRSDIEKIAHLARLAVAEEDMERYVSELSNILQMVEQMNSVDTRTVVPMAHPM
jgi:aspartyl-tRNA(Asn)/glutamyl-tRNA(Gln) amidotransferase subunit C